MATELTNHERKKMDKYFEKHFPLTEEELDEVEYAVDEFNTVAYHWKFTIPNGQYKGTYKQTYEYASKKISHVKLNDRELKQAR